MTKKNIIILLAAVCGLAAQAQENRPEWKLTAAQVEAHARDFAVQLKPAQAAQTVALQAVEATDFANLRIYNIEGGGWVIASTDSRAQQILAYSDEGAFVAAEMPESVRYWLQGYEEEIDSLGDLTPQALERMAQKTRKSAGAKNGDIPEAMPCLLTTAWNQSGYGYNSMTPYDSVLGRHVTVGCVALAMGQVVRYHQFPAHGYGQHSYSYEGIYDCWRYDTLSVNFQEEGLYDYSQMPAQLTDSSTAAQRDAVALLLYHCGVAVSMQYNNQCNGASGASSISNVMKSLQKYFHYSPDAVVHYRSEFSDSQWIDSLKEEIGHYRPVLYSGGSGVGHAYVMDGYDSNDCFHINWGWGGMDNGYYSLSPTEPYASPYVSPYLQGSQVMIAHLEPQRSPMPVMVQGSDLLLDTSVYYPNGVISGSYSMTNIGDAAGDCYVALHVYASSENPVACLDQHHFHIEPGSTQTHTFAVPHTLAPYPTYGLRMQVSRDSITEPCPYSQLYNDFDYNSRPQFSVVDTAALSSLVLYSLFADNPSFHYENVIPSIEFDLNGNFQPFFYPLFNRQTAVNLIFPMLEQASGQYCFLKDRYKCSYYLPYDPQQAPNGDPEPYPECGPSQREVEFVGRVAHYVDSLHFVDSTARLDSDGDGTIDHLVIVMRKVEDDQRRGMLADHTTRYPDTLPPLTINGLRVDRYSLIGIVNAISMQRMASAVSHAMGLPETAHRKHHTDIHPDAAGSILAGGTNAPSAIFKHRYLGLGDEPAEITADGTYTLNSSDLSTENNLYYIRSAADSNQWYLVEYRYFGSDSSRNGLYISRWVGDAPVDACYGGNAWADYYNTPDNYWTFRPGSAVDTIDGNPDQAHFSMASGRNFFSPLSDPHPYLADGTPEVSFKITGIAESGTQCSFKVHFFTPGEDPYADEPEGIAETESPLACRLYPNPTTGRITLLGLPEVPRAVTLYDMVGRPAATFRHTNSFDISHLPQGSYIVQIQTSKNTYHMKVVKKSL